MINRDCSVILTSVCIQGDHLSDNSGKGGQGNLQKVGGKVRKRPTVVHMEAFTFHCLKLYVHFNVLFNLFLLLTIGFHTVYSCAARWKCSIKCHL